VSVALACHPAAPMVASFVPLLETVVEDGLKPGVCSFRGSEETWRKSVACDDAGFLPCSSCLIWFYAQLLTRPKQFVVVEVPAVAKCESGPCVPSSSCAEMTPASGNPPGSEEVVCGASVLVADEEQPSGGRPLPVNVADASCATAVESESLDVANAGVAVRASSAFHTRKGDVCDEPTVFPPADTGAPSACRPGHPTAFAAGFARAIRRNEVSKDVHAAYVLPHNVGEWPTEDVPPWVQRQHDLEHSHIEQRDEPVSAESVDVDDEDLSWLLEPISRCHLLWSVAADLCGCPFLDRFYSFGKEKDKEAGGVECGIPCFLCGDFTQEDICNSCANNELWLDADHGLCLGCGMACKRRYCQVCW